MTQLVDYTLLPRDIWIEIFQYLSDESLYKLAFVSKNLSKLTKAFLVKERPSTYWFEKNILLKKDDAINSLLILNTDTFVVSLHKSILIIDYRNEKQYRLEGINSILLHRINSQYFCSLSKRGTIRIWDWQKKEMFAKIKLDIKKNNHTFSIASNQKYLIVGNIYTLHVIDISQLAQKKFIRERIFWYDFDKSYINNIVLKKNNKLILHCSSPYIYAIDLNTRNSELICNFKNVVSMFSFKENTLLLSENGFIADINNSNTITKNELPYRDRKESYEKAFSVSENQFITRKNVFNDKSSNYIYSFWNSTEQSHFEFSDTLKADLAAFDDGAIVCYTQNRLSIFQSQKRHNNETEQNKNTISCAR